MYCTECGAQSSEDRQFCTKCGTALQKPGQASSQRCHKFSGARYASEGQWAWGGKGKGTDLELANGRLKFKGGEIDICAARNVSLVRQPFPWALVGVELAIGIPTFVMGLSMGGDAGVLLKSIGVGGVAASVASTIASLVVRRSQWLLIEYSGHDGDAQRVHFKMSKQQTGSLYSILQSRLKR